ncbi:hypothetical protein KJ652_03830 [Patescibacteria group bacterium]|nr:hypothetical protein [Patescibacteria group bacterium]MBU1123695.1 hypothetical protein [Patescibacteria group bacterium]MBU1911627.1 hypothetical protein [Patescibacteria group bacterium]
MALSALRRLRYLDLEERILNGAAFLAVISVFMPWTSGYMLGSDSVSYSGLGFYTSFLGISVLLLNIFVLLITLVPLFGGTNLIKKRNKDSVRLFCSIQSTVLVLAALSVLMRVSFNFSRMEIRFGINMALISCIVVAFYSYLRIQEQKKTNVEEIFHQASRPDRITNKIDHQPPVAVPAPPEPEEHRIIS